MLNYNISLKYYIFSKNIYFFERIEKDATAIYQSKCTQKDNKQNSLKNYCKSPYLTIKIEAPVSLNTYL